MGFDRAAGVPTTEVAATGQVFALLVLVCGTAQLVVGLVLVIALMRNRDSLDVDDASTLKW